MWRCRWRRWWRRSCWSQPASWKHGTIARPKRWPRSSARVEVKQAEMNPRIAIPLPHGGDPEYAERAIPQYERAIELSGGEPVRIPLDRSPAEVMKLSERCDAV